MKSLLSLAGAGLLSAVFAASPSLAVAQNFAPSGAPTELPQFAFNASVAAAADGRNVAVWTPEATPPSAFVFQRFGADGNALGTLTTIAPPSGLLPEGPARVAMAANGSFVIAHTVIEPGTSDDPVLPSNQTQRSILVTRFAADGSRIGEDIIVDRFRTISRFANDADLDISSDTNGNFVIAWRRSTTLVAGIFPTNAGLVTDTLLARRYGSNGLPSSAAVSFDSSSALLSLLLQVEPALSGPAVFADAAGGFSVAWAFRPAGAITPQHVFTRSYGPAGIPQTLRLRVDETSPTGATSVVSIDLSGDFAGRKTVIWDGCGGVCARRLTADGRPTGVQNLVSAGIESVVGTDLGFREFPQLATTAQGDVIAVWAPTGTNRSTPAADFLRAVGRADEATSTAPLVRVTGLDETRFGNPQIAVDGLGNVIVVYPVLTAQGSRLRVQRYVAAP